MRSIPIRCRCRRRPCARKVLENKALEDVAAQALLGRTVVSTGTVAQADGFQKIFFPPPVDDND